jgi:sulfide-dependent adenosine diphosphate thiazole synthase
MDEVIITRAITETYIKELMANLELDVAIVGGGPAGLAAGYYLAQRGVKSAIFERKLSIGGGMWGGGMMFSRIVVQTEAKNILDEFEVAYSEYQPGYYVADSVETVAALTYRCAKSGCRIFNLLTAEDVVIRENDRLAGLVLNWSAVDMAGLHVDPLVMRSKLVIDATGHDAEICRTVTRKIGKKLNTDTGDVIGEKPMWAEVGERELIARSCEIYPGLLAAGMAVNAVYGLPRMGPIFGGMLLSGRNAAQKAVELLAKM